MISLFERKIAFRYLRARREEGFISLNALFSFLGIMLGVATLIIVMSVMNGFRDELMGRVLGFNGHMGVYSAKIGGMELSENLLAKVKGYPFVKLANPIIEQQALASQNDVAAGVLVHGLRPQDLAQRPMIAKNIRSGRLSDFGKNKQTLLIGQGVANKFYIRVGDTLKLIAPKGTSTAFGTIPRAREFKVIGTFEVGMHQFDTSALFMPLDDAQHFFQTKKRITGIEIFFHNPEEVAIYRKVIMQDLGPGYYYSDWRQVNGSFVSALDIERNVMFIILTLIIVIASFNIISSLIMLVKDKAADIAIMRTLGATRGMMMRVFCTVGSSIGIVGTFCGFLLGMLFVWNIETIRQWIQYITKTNLFSPEVYFLTQIPAKVDFSEVLTIVLLSLVLSFLASLYPAWRAARLDPVEVLRYE